MPLPPLPKKRGSVIDHLPDVPAKRPDLTPVKPSLKAVARVSKDLSAPVKSRVSPQPNQTPASKPLPQDKPATQALSAGPNEGVAQAPLTSAARLSGKPGRLLRHRCGGKKLFVLDTNVLLHDPSSLFRFEEHDVFLPMVTLEELDGHKKGLSDASRNAREVSRYLDQLVELSDEPIQEGVPLHLLGDKAAGGKLFFQTQKLFSELPQAMPQGKADNQILGVVQALQERVKNERNVVLVSKDINMRIKATALGLFAEDYLSDKTIEDSDLLHAGHLALPEDFFSLYGNDIEPLENGNFEISGAFTAKLFANLFVYLPDNSFMARVSRVEGTRATLVPVKDYLSAKNTVWGIHARNREQCFALNLLMDPDIDFVSLLGQAGTGKTLITLAAALAQTMDQRRFNEVIFTRATVSVGEDIGYLPGTEEEKMQPWMGALEDNLEVLNKSSMGGDWARSAANDLIRSRIKVKSMSFMRGRTFLNKLVIIDEAQNLSPKQMKTLISRAGAGSKIVCLGNIAQIDTPYLTEGSSGLTYVVDRFKGWAHAGHITLQRGERSRLADYANEEL